MTCKTEIELALPTCHTEKHTAWEIKTRVILTLNKEKTKILPPAPFFVSLACHYCLQNRCYDWRIFSFGVDAQNWSPAPTSRALRFRFTMSDCWRLCKLLLWPTRDSLGAHSQRYAPNQPRNLALLGNSISTEADMALALHAFRLQFPNPGQLLANGGKSKCKVVTVEAPMAGNLAAICQAFGFKPNNL